MADRKAEIDQKRAKIEAMRLERQRREAERARRNEAVQNVAQLLNSRTNNLDADSILLQLGIEVTDGQQRSNGTHGASNGFPHTIEYAQEAFELDADAATGLQCSPTRMPNEEALLARYRRPLTVSKVHSTNVAPSEIVSYSKETQTNIEQNIQPQRRVNINADDVSSTPGSLAGSHFGSPRVGAMGLLAHLDWDDEFTSGVLTSDARLIENDEMLELCLSGAGRQHPRATSAPRTTTRSDSTPCRCVLLQRLDSTSSAQSGASQSCAALCPVQGSSQPRPTVPAEVSDEDCTRICSSDTFVNFVMRATRLVERTLEQDDTLVDYTADKSNSAWANNPLDCDEQVLMFERDFFEEKWCRNRLVTAIEWHHQFPELLLTAYSARQDLTVVDNYCSPSAGYTAMEASESGVCLIWNARYKPTTPEFIFTCESPLTAACFMRQQPNLLVGGTYSGQVVIWDTRVLRRTPVHRSPLSTTAHTHPVYCVQSMGGGAQSQLMSVSSEGRMCIWSIEMLSQPLERLELAFDRSGKSHVACGNVAVTSLSSPAYDAGAFLVGAEDGGVYLGNRNGQTQNRTGLVSCFEAHGAHVSAVHCSPHALGNCDLSHLFLTAAFDSTVRLWSLREDQPLCTLERTADYLNDAQFSPTHPALFATADSLGRIELWNLLRDAESPIGVHAVSSCIGAQAQCKVRWNATGNRLAAGDCAGHVHLLSLADRVAQPHADDAARLARVLHEMKAARTSCSHVASHSLPHRIGSPHHRSISPLAMAING